MRLSLGARLLLSAALAASAAACTTPPPPPTAPVLAGEEPNKLEVRSAPVSHAVYFAPGASAVSPTEQATLRSFLHYAQARPEAPATVAAGPSALDAARSGRVMALLRHAGLNPTATVLRSGKGTGTVTVTLQRETVVLPHCPNWPTLGNDETLNMPSTNLGCATATDLAVMVADPHDLVSGRVPGPESAEPGIRAVEIYRGDGGDNKGGAPSPAPSTTSGVSNAH